VALGELRLFSPVGEERYSPCGCFQRGSGVLEAQLSEPGPPSSGLQSNEYNVAYNFQKKLII